MIYVGENCCLSTSTVSTFLEHEPQPTATKNMIHFSQSKRFLIKSNSFIIDAGSDNAIEIDNIDN